MHHDFIYKKFKFKCQHSILQSLRQLALVVLTVLKDQYVHRTLRVVLKCVVLQFYPQIIIQLWHNIEVNIGSLAHRLAVAAKQLL